MNNENLWRRSAVVDDVSEKAAVAVASDEDADVNVKLMVSRLMKLRMSAILRNASPYISSIHTTSATIKF